MTHPSTPTSAPSPVPPSGPDALDAFEARLAALLDQGDEAALRAFVTGLPPELTGLPPDAEPDGARRSSAELRALAVAGCGADETPPEGMLRAGHLLEGSAATGVARVLPAFALALGPGAGGDALRARFDDLWAVDLALWDALDEAPRTIARMWLESPGRRLLQDLRSLRKMPAADPLGATRATLARIHRAAGVENAPAPSDGAAFEQWKARKPERWRELHLTVPGRAMLAWSPHDDHPTSAFAALELAEEGCPASLRGSAIAWLLRRMHEDPRYKIDGISRDLRDELPARLASALSDEGRASSSRAPLSLEEVALAHAARINAADTAPGAVFRTWAVARWLVGCLWRSPFFGGDGPALVERLRALLPRAAIAPREDPLDAARFDRIRGLDVTEVALVGGALAEPLRVENAIAIPPVPLARALRRLAGRATLRPGEEEAEDLCTARASELDWPAPHVAPPIVARWWLTERQLHWLGEAPAAAQAHTLALLSRAPRRFGWICFAVMEEGAALTPEARQLALGVWRRWRDGEDAPPAHEQCALGIGVLGGLDDNEAMSVLAVASSADGTWPAFLMDAVARSAERTEREALWRSALEHLMDLAGNAGAGAEAQLNAALFVALRTSSRKMRAEDIVARLSRLAQQPPFSRHLGLQRELRRRGALPPGAAAGGGR